MSELVNMSEIDEDKCLPTILFLDYLASNIYLLCVNFATISFKIYSHRPKWPCFRGFIHHGDPGMLVGIVGTIAQGNNPIILTI